MAIPDAFTADMLRQISKSIADLPTRTRYDSVLMPRKMERQLRLESEAQGPRFDNPLLAGATPGHLFGMKVVVADVPPQITYDWSECRSPSRAKRRHARGIPQRVKIIKTDVAYLIDQAALDMGRDWERRAMKVLFGE